MLVEILLFVVKVVSNLVMILWRFFRIELMVFEMVLVLIGVNGFCGGLRLLMGWCGLLMFVGEPEWKRLGYAEQRLLLPACAVYRDWETDRKSVV